jgi:hypothetical protein
MLLLCRDLLVMLLLLPPPQFEQYEDTYTLENVVVVV